MQTITVYTKSLEDLQGLRQASFNIPLDETIMLIELVGKKVVIITTKEGNEGNGRQNHKGHRQPVYRVRPDLQR